MSRHVRALTLLWTLYLLAQGLAATALTERRTPGHEASAVLHSQTATGPALPHNGEANKASLHSTAIALSSTSITTGLVNPAIISVTTLGTCAFASIDYVTRRPPSQCYTQARPSKSALSSSSDVQENASSNDPIKSHIPNTPTSGSQESTKRDDTTPSIVQNIIPEKTALALPDPVISRVEIFQTTQAVVSSTPEVVAVEIATVVDPDSESPLNDAKFLSFEDWKKENLPRVPDDANTRQPRPSRARPGLDTPLEGLGDEGEIVFDFSGFSGSIAPGQAQAIRNRDTQPAGSAASGSEEPGNTQRRRPRDAGKTCKERSNYASFDCGSSVLKTNPQGKKASSILVENKDSYMLNECSAGNKFLIVELCDEIKIDTIVLANFEFFSSIFRTFKVSVSDRYPVRIDKWKDIGTFEARNTRDIQAFLVEDHTGFARYVRIEFLTHYGSEFYCPVSLFRIHGVTAFEEYKLEQLSAEDREGDDDEDAVAQPVTSVSTGEVEPQEPATLEATMIEAAPPLPATINADGNRSEHRGVEVEPSSLSEPATSSGVLASFAKSSTTSDSSTLLVSHTLPTALHSSSPDLCLPTESPGTPSHVEGTAATMEAAMSQLSSSAEQNTASATVQEHVTTSSRSQSASASNPVVVNQVPTSVSGQVEPFTVSVSFENGTRKESTIGKNSTIAFNPSGSNPVQSSSVAASTPASASASASSTVAREPATQESFFKTIHKRLQHLEANSTLSLQYIESQSALLREAFGQVERRQLAKTTTFLSILNATVSAELSRFQSEYEQLWQSTLMELASQRDEGRRERELLGERVKILAEEMVNQKRLMAAQATILLLCLGLIVFSRFGGMSTAIDSTLIQGMQEIVNKGKKMRAEEKERHAGSRWRWESPWASPSRRSKSSGVVTPVGRDYDRIGTMTPRSPESGGNSLDFDGHDENRDPYGSLDGQERLEGEDLLKPPELSQVVQGSQLTQSAPTTPLSELPPENIPRGPDVGMSNG